ncbi:MAG: hypothetical protein AAF447_01450 [Myxococcota bacterium]
MRTSPSVKASLLAGLLACGGSTDDGGSVMDMSAPRPGDAGNTGDLYAIEQVNEANAGEQLAMTLGPSGQPAVAYYDSLGEVTGTCGEGDDVRFTLHVAERQGRSWVEEDVAEVLSLVLPRGLDLGVLDGELAVAGISGELFVNAMNTYCSAHDVALYTPDGAGGWGFETLVEDSGEAPFDGPGANEGFVVGLFPALATNGTRTFIAYRDIHFGGIQSDDERRADLEAVFLGEGAVAVDGGRGAGRFMDAAFDGDDRPLVAYVNDFNFNPASGMSSRGTHAARENTDGSWDTVLLGEDDTAPPGPSLWVGDDDVVRVAWQDPEGGKVVVATLTDPERFDELAGWSFERVGAPGLQDGEAPSGVTAGGFTAIAYRRCGDAGATSCRAADDALVLAWRPSGGGADDWSYEVIDEGTNIGPCGLQPSVALDDLDTLWVGYVCKVDVGGTSEDRVFVAERLEPFE